MRRIAIVIVAALLAAAGAALITRSPVRVASGVDPDVTLSCAATTGLRDDACRAWGDEILAGGPPSFTFEMDDLARLELDRSWLGWGSECSAVYYIERYAASPVSSVEVPCSGGP